MTEMRIESPSAKQKQFLLARTKHIGFGGARGGGKSWGVRTKAKLLCIRYPGIKVLIVRRTYPELTANHISILRTELLGIASYNDKALSIGNSSGSSAVICCCTSALFF